VGIWLFGDERSEPRLETTGLLSGEQLAEGTEWVRSGPVFDFLDFLVRFGGGFLACELPDGFCFAFPKGAWLAEGVSTTRWWL
jgi:hypothetical protein